MLEIARKATLCAVTLLVAACGTPYEKLPKASSICIDFGPEGTEEAAYVRRKATEYAKSYGYAVVTSGCDLQVKYVRLGESQGEVLRTGLLGPSISGLWRQEGMVTLSQGSTVLVQDESVNLRDYKSKQGLLEDLAWSFIRPVTQRFQPTVPVK